jgi:hypothetical protein
VGTIDGFSLDVVNLDEHICGHNESPLPSDFVEQPMTLTNRALSQSGCVLNQRQPTGP